MPNHHSAIGTVATPQNNRESKVHSIILTNWGDQLGEQIVHTAIFARGKEILLKSRWLPLFMSQKLCGIVPTHLTSTYFFLTTLFLQCYTKHISHAKIIKHTALDRNFSSWYYNLQRRNHIREKKLYSYLSKQILLQSNLEQKEN